MKWIATVLPLVGMAMFGVGCSTSQNGRGATDAGSPGNTEEVNWSQFEARKVALTADEAVGVVRSSVDLMGRQITKDTKKNGVKFLRERVDQSGFAFKMEMSQSVGGMSIISSLPTTVVRFDEVSKLVIKKAKSGKETGIALMSDKGQLWELPFSTAPDRDRLLSALTVLCKHLVIEKPVVTH